MAIEAEITDTVATRLSRLWLVLTGLVAVTLAALAVWLGRSAAPAVYIAGIVVLSILVAAGWQLILLLARPIDRLSLDLLVMARDNLDHALRLGDRHWLARVTGSVEALRQRLRRAERDMTTTLADATERVEEQKRRLEAILLDLSEGIVVCNAQHQILLYNQAAAAMVDPPLALGLGRVLFSALTPEPVLHALERCRDRRPGMGPTVGDSFVCGTTDGRRLLRARLGLIIDAQQQQPPSYVLALRDIGAELAVAARRDDLLQSATEGIRAPLANLRAAAETTADHPELPPDQRAAFEQIILKECATLSERLETLARGYRELGGGQWLMAEIHSNDLLAALKRRLATDTPIELTATGLPAWLYGDSLSLLVLFDHLVRRLHEHLSISAVDAAFSPTERRVHFDLVWHGKPVPASVIEAWLDMPLVGGLGPLNGRAVLQRHGSELWSQTGRLGEAILRMPLPSGELSPAPSSRRAERPEFYDFDLLRRPLPTGEFSERSLHQITYVVFDVETTGLHPSAGDEVVELAAVRVVNGRVLTTETFERLVKPRRRIPPESTVFHGITDTMVQDKPSFSLVLPQFQQFAADAALVAHNAAFDLQFINQTAAECGLRFDQPVLDTLLLSAFLDPDEPDHSLDGVAARLGLNFGRRHSALADSLVTAAILAKQIERLEERGLKCLGDVMAATGMTAEIRARQRQF